MHRKQKSVHENLVRQRDRHSNIEDIYIIGEQIGQGGLCSIYKIRKKDDQIGGAHGRIMHGRVKYSVHRHGHSVPR